MDHGFAHTVLLVCGCETHARNILQRLYEAGIGVIGPAPTAGHAMALAAQTAATVALVATPPSGRRNASEFARDLMATWGIRSWVLSGAQDTNSASEEAWAADHQSVSVLKRALHGLDAGDLAETALAST
jgi:hypothetical protein